jgi:hypothetical protein
MAEKSTSEAFEPLGVHWRDIWQDRSPVRRLTLISANI